MLPALHVSPDISIVLYFNLINIFMIKSSKSDLHDSIVIQNAHKGPMPGI